MEFATSVAENVLGRLASYASQEIGLAWGVRFELKKLNETLSTIRLVLQDAERKQMKNPLITHWLGNLKDVCNDADDVLDEVEFKQLRNRVLINNKRRSSRVKAKVHEFFSRWNPIVFNFKTSHKIKAIRERLAEVNNEKSQFSLIEVAQLDEDRRAPHDNRRETDSLPETCVVGRDDDKKQIITHLLSDTCSRGNENVAVISIVGLGGLGKTTLAKMVYNDNKVKVNFEMTMWICVSNYFDVKKLVGDISSAATMQKCENLSLDLMKIKLLDVLRDKKFLLVLDDVWDTESTGVTTQKWRELLSLLNAGASGSKIMVTTRSESVASLVHSVQSHVLRGLSQEDSMILFKKRAFNEEDEQRFPHLVEIGEEIVKKCGGVPLAIVALGSVLYLKNNKQDWIEMRDHHMWSTTKNDETMQVLKLSYDALPSYLKPCFAFCSLFPKDYEFCSFEIISLWIAQSYIISGDGIQGNRGYIQIGLGYIRELCSRSLFVPHVVEGVEHAHFNIHDLVHDLAISVARVECSTVNCRPSDGFEKVLHVSISKKDLSEDENSNRVLEFLLQSDKLRTILVPDTKAGINNLTYLKICISRFKFIRVLDLRESTIEEIPSLIGNLSHLRLLNLSGNKIIKRLPDSICIRLLQLQILNLGGCESFKELPKDLGNLINLILLVITTQQECFPKGTFRGLNLLQILVFEKCENLKSLGEEFESLSDLRQLWINECENLEFLPSNLKNLSAFGTLSIRGCKKLELMRSGQGIQGLRSFTVSESNLEALPDWLQESACTLQSIYIQDWQNLMALPEWLKDLASLEVLSIHDCPKLSALPEGLHRLTALRELKIEDCDDELSKAFKKQLKGEEWARFKHNTKIELDDVFSDSEDEDEDGVIMNK